MSMKELQRLHVIHQVMEKQVTQEKAGELLGLTDRQIRRISQRVRAVGDAGLAHRSRGKPSNRAIDGKTKARVLKVYGTTYADFGPTLAAEKLSEREGIPISDETLRRWLLEAGIDHFKRRKRPHRQWRERKAHRGELIQMDGSHHPWFEARGPACVLMAYIDDATGRVFARFYAYEGTIPAMDSFKRYVRCYGLPLAVYADKHTTYKSPAEPTLTEQLAGQEPMSQFERSLSELGVEMIHAHSPQAKGRIERLFGTFQDRVIKEMRLAGITMMEEANRFLGGYLPIYNRRFAVKPTEAADLHRPIPKRYDLDQTLCIKTERALRNDFTVAHNRTLYQIQNNLRAHRVTVEDRMDGTIRITHQGQPLRYHAITHRPVKAHETPNTLFRKPGTKPSPDHPWKKTFELRKKKEAAASIL
ncbi:MAG: ISNCY family transposase [Acidobacteria bacterium]|nr:ISNCY family transposase [Acidobacteriota bacterium]